MSNLYLTRHGLSLNKEEGKIVIKKDGEVLNRIPIKFVNNVIVIAAVQITYGAVSSILGNGGSITYLASDGSIRGILGGFKNNGLKIVKQAEAYLELNKRLALAKYFVKNKISQQRNFIAVYNRKFKNNILENTVKKLGYFINLCDKQETINKLLGIEGITARIYFDCYNTLLEKSGFVWNGRNRRPPKDPVNAMLSFAYCLLEKEIKYLINGEGYHCGIGYLHSLSNTDNAFVYDVMELLRTSAAEKFVFKCINYGWLKPDDFQCNDSGCFMTETARNVFIQRFEECMAEANFEGKTLQEQILQKLSEIDSYIEKGVLLSA